MGLVRLPLTVKIAAVFGERLMYDLFVQQVVRTSSVNILGISQDMTTFRRLSHRYRSRGNGSRFYAPLLRGLPILIDG